MPWLLKLMFFHSYDNLVREIDEEQERIAAELFQICEDVIEFKNRKTAQIESLEAKISEESQISGSDFF
jgi:hypothetical protein